MLVAIGDTHASEGHQLTEHALAAVRAADCVIHTGDFTTAAVLEAFEREADDLAAVVGNNDDRRVRERLPETRVVEALGNRFVVAHGDGRTDTSLSLLARQEDADAIVAGHSHMPDISAIDGIPLINPGSHADPRWYRPAFARIERAEAGDSDRAGTERAENTGGTREPGPGGDERTVSVTLETPEGEVFERATL